MRAQTKDQIASFTNKKVLNKSGKNIKKKISFIFNGFLLSREKIDLFEIQFKDFV